MLDILACSVWLTLERIAAMVTNQGHGLANSINGTFARAMVDAAIVRFEFLFTLETRFDHN